LRSSARHVLLAAGAAMAFSAGVSCLPATASSQVRDAHGVAVIAGNRNYRHDRATDVTYAHRDAAAFRRYVVEVLGYDPDRIIYVRDATLGRLTEVFGNERNHQGELWSILDPKGRSDVVVFYSGHGGPGLTDKRGYLLPVEAGPDTAEIGGYPLDLLYRNLGRLAEARSVRLFVDACFTGESHTGMLITKASPVIARAGLPESVADKLVVLTAASSDQLASWDDKARHGLFTKHLLDALYGGGDLDDDGRVTLAEAKSYLDDEMTKAARRMRRRQVANLMSAVDDAVLSVKPPAGYPARREISLLTPDGVPFEDVSPAASRLSQLLGRPFSVEAKEPSGWTDLHYAAAANAPKLIDALVEAGMAADVRLRDRTSDRPKFGERLVQTLAALGHNENFEDWRADGETPLMIAAYSNAGNAVTALMSNGADVNATNKDYRESPALSYAVQSNHVGLVKPLMNLTRMENAKFLGTAFKFGSYESATVLLERITNPNKEAKAAMRDALSIAFSKPSHKRTPALINVAQEILAFRIDVNHIVFKYYKETLLHKAVLSLYPEAVRELLKHGADANARQVDDMTPLHLVSRMDFRDKYWSQYPQETIAELLIQHGANVNARDRWGLTPLHWLGLGAEPLANFTGMLIRAGADVNAKDSDGYTPLDKWRPGVYAAKKLIAAGARCNRTCEKE